MQTGRWYWTEIKSILISLLSPSQIWHSAVDSTQKTQCLVIQHRVLCSALPWEAMEMEEMKVKAGEKAIVCRWLLVCFVHFKIGKYLLLIFFSCANHHLKHYMKCLIQRVFFCFNSGPNPLVASCLSTERVLFWEFRAQWHFWGLYSFSSYAPKNA